MLKKDRKRETIGQQKGMQSSRRPKKKNLLLPKCNGSSIERNTKQERKMFVNAFLIPEIFNSFSVPNNNKRKFRWDMRL
jgi:hypothetical protein